MEGQGVAAAEFRLVQLQMRIYDLEFNLAQATGVDYKARSALRRVDSPADLSPASRPCGAICDELSAWL